VKSTDEKGWSIASTLFDCGRLYIQLRFHQFQAAFLLAGKGHRRRSIAIASRIERLSRRLELTAEARGVLEALREAGTEFLEVYTSEWFSDNIITLYDRISEKTIFPEDIYEDGEEDRRSTCDLHLAREIEATARLRAALLDGCDRGSRSAFELGELVEQAIHPRDVHRHFFEFHPIDGCRSNGYPGGYFSLIDRSPGDVPPPDGWLRRVRAMLKDLGLGDGTPGILPLRLPASVEARRKAVGAITRTIRDRFAGSDAGGSLVSGASEDGGPPGQEGGSRASGQPGYEIPEANSERIGRATGWRAAGHLGIEIHENERMLRRAGKPDLELSRPLEWNLAQAFLDAGDRYLSLSEQRAIWDQSDLSDDVEEETITMTIGRLNKSLVRLDVRIVMKSSRRRMQEIPAKQ
jgi:hypothetical protein